VSTQYKIQVILPREDGLLADRVLDHVRNLIATDRLCSGDRVNELEISQTLGMSRGPVREAVRRLAASGLLVAEPNLGSRVVTLDAEAARALFEVREALEAMAAGLAAMKMSPAEKADLLKMLEEHEAAMDVHGSKSYPAGPADWDFHLAILRGARNEVAWRVCGNELRDLLSLLRARHSRREGRGRRALQEHRWVAEAIAAGHADLASALMGQHIRASRDGALATLDEPANPQQERSTNDSDVA